MTDQTGPSGPDSELKFFRSCITVMAGILVAGFVVQLLMGRSSFASPVIVHLHAATFMGWVVITLAQVWLVSAGRRDLHRRLGVLALVWVLAMVVLGPLVTLNAVRTGRVPFFFQPQHFLLADPATLIGFIVLFAAAVAMRNRPDWHPRLQIGAFMLLLGPGLGRILPLPLLKPYAFEAAALTAVLAAAYGAVRDLRAHGRVHPAWAWSAAVLAAVLLAARLIAFSPVGDAIYAAAIAQSPAAATDGRAFPPPPPLPPPPLPPPPLPPSSKPAKP